MDKDQIMKYLMIAGAAYLVYWYLTQEPSTGAAAKLPKCAPGVVSTPGYQCDPTGVDISVVTRPGTPLPGTPRPATPVATVPDAGSAGGTNAGFTKPSDQHLMRAATNPNWANEGASYKMSVHQWNWYRTKYQTDVVGNSSPDPNTYSPSMDDITDPNKGITAAEYHSLLGQKGLSGLGWTPIVPQYLSQWTM